MDLAKTIRERREALNLTQCSLAMRACVARQTVVELEATGKCREPQLRRIARVLNLDWPLEPGDRSPGEISSARKKRQDLPVPGERPNIWQLMNRVRVLQQRRAEKARRAVESLIAQRADEKSD